MITYVCNLYIFFAENIHILKNVPTDNSCLEHALLSSSSERCVELPDPSGCPIPASSSGALHGILEQGKGLSCGDQQTAHDRSQIALFPNILMGVHQTDIQSKHIL